MRHAGLLALLVLNALPGCKPEAPAEPPLTLAAASTRATFGTVEQLGPHLARASITRTDLRDGKETASHTEVSEIGWQDWDHFRYKRVQDGDPAIEVLVVGGRAWARQGDGPWQARKDPEPFRVQLRTTWDAWDQALEVFGERVQLDEQTAEVVDGRPARRYAVALTALPEGTKARKRGFEPVRLSGLVWLDEATAVQLTAAVEGEVRQGNLLRRITLKLARSGWGQDLGLAAPTEVAPDRSAEELVPRPRSATP